MPGRGPQTFKKRQKEQQRKEKQQEKMAKRLARKDQVPGSVNEDDDLNVENGGDAGGLETADGEQQHHETGDFAA